MTGRKPGKGGFDLSDDDRRVWRDVTSDYEKLHSSALLPEAVPLPPSPGNREKKEERPQPVLRKNLPPLLPGAGDAKAFKPVRKSARAIEAVLDLHGHTESAAHAALLRFLARCQGEGMRLVRVITGKGRGGEGKLRRAVLEWLNLPELRGLVISCAHAPARQGGEGALDLILRRRR